MRVLRLALSLAVFCCLNAAVAGPLPDGGITGDEVAAVIKARGFPVTLGKDGDGDPKITSKFTDLYFEVHFYNCTAGRCASIQFSKGFDMPEGVTLEKLNEWNRNFRFGRAFRDDETDPFVQMDIDVEKGSTTESIANNLEMWLAVLDEFAKMLDWGGDEERPST